MPAGGQFDVGGFDIAVEHRGRAAVQIAEGITQLPDPVQHLIFGQKFALAPGLVDDLPQIQPLDEIHDQIFPALIGEIIADFGQIGMIEAGENAGFLKKLLSIGVDLILIGHAQGQHLFDGGHLTHGWKLSVTGRFFNIVPYHVKDNGYIDLKAVKELAQKHKPRLMWVGATAYTREFPFKELGKIADSVGAYLVADIAHIAGLVAAGVHTSPVPYVDIITTTTHKTLRGPRGGMIMVTEHGLKKDPELATKIDKAIMPGSQGGPHNHTTAAIAVALKEANTPAFRKYAKQIVVNANALAEALKKHGVKLVSNGTDNHLMLMKVGKARGAIVEVALDAVGMTANKNTIPGEPSSPFYPSGIRLGTPSITTRGMKVREMKKIAKWIAQTLEVVKNEELPKGKKAKEAYLKQLVVELPKNTIIKKIRKEVRDVCRAFPAEDKFV